MLPLSQRAEAKLRLRFPRQPAEVVERLRLANALAEYCIAPAAVVNGGAGPAREPLEVVTRRFPASI